EAVVPMQNVGGINVFGGTFPALVWHNYMAQAMDGQPVLGWAPPGATPPPAFLQMPVESLRPPAPPRSGGGRHPPPPPAAPADATPHPRRRRRRCQQCRRRVRSGTRRVAPQPSTAAGTATARGTATAAGEVDDARCPRLPARSPGPRHDRRSAASPA